MSVISVADEVTRLLLAAVLAGLIGWEREAQHRPAGLRTHMLVAIGSALLMIVSQSIFLQYYTVGRVDPGRIAAQVVSGIGFLGAGTILREGPTIRGLTTAASLWVAAAIGLAVGAGLMTGALVTTVVTLVALRLLPRVEAKMQRRGRQQWLRLHVYDQPGRLGQIGAVLGAEQVNISQIEIAPSSGPGVEEQNGDGAAVAAVRLLVELPKGRDLLALMQTLRHVDGVIVVEVGDNAAAWH